MVVRHRRQPHGGPGSHDTPLLAAAGRESGRITIEFVPPSHDTGFPLVPVIQLQALLNDAGKAIMPNLKDKVVVCGTGMEKTYRRIYDQMASKR
jgi:hypothetical protein